MSFRVLARCAACALAISLAISRASTAEDNQAGDKQRGIALFEKTVKPLLEKQCFSCHSHASKKSSGGLVVDSLGALIAGGDTGPAVVPKKPAESLILNAIKRDEDFVQMPPKSTLAKTDVEAVEEWIKLGAPWPGDTGKVARVIEKITDEDRAWWAFQPVKVVEPPKDSSGWARNEIDEFVAAKLREAELTPAPEASRAALVRRMYFDLWGLPPTPDEVQAFVEDKDPKAYERLIDRLLESPHYGERWARHWLDLVRYADSDGYRIDDYRPNAWRFRDYVIRSLNNDKPYDQFVQEQLAGDELFPGDPEALVGTGYLRQGIYEYNNRDVRGQWSVILNDITDTTGDVFLGLGMQCARCHDHKFDPILQKDYFRLQAFFSGILPYEEMVVATDDEQAEYAEELKAWEAKTAELREELAALEAPFLKKEGEGAIRKFPPDIQAMIRKPADERSPLEHQLAELAYRQVTREHRSLDKSLKGEAKEKILALRKKLSEFDKLKPAPLPIAMTATDCPQGAADVTIPKKGDANIEPGFLTLLNPAPAKIESLPHTTGRRAALAIWLTTGDNPLTARVMANRVWQYHFGRGLAVNSSDFGKLGEPPTHPELLDWMADRFVQDGWSLKRLHKLILLSATYRQSAEHPQMAAGRLRDPENRLLWRGNVRRLDAEQIRDALFAVTGEIDFTAGGPGAISTQPRRSVYTRFMRNNRDPLLDVFDAPFWFTSASSRDTTTTPVQSLLLVNSQLMLQRAKALASRLERDEPSGGEAQIDRAYRLTFGRGATKKEIEAAQEFMLAQAKRIEPEEAASAQAQFLYGKIPYRDGQAAICDPKGAQRSFRVPHDKTMPSHDFTIEAFVLPRSISDSGTPRAVATKWNGGRDKQGWLFGITGKASRRKPQTLVMQMFGEKLDGEFGEQAIFSDQHIALDKPYYLAAAVTFADKKPGAVTFYVKDLSNDDEPLLVAKVSHQIRSGINNDAPLTLGSLGTNSGSFFDGMLDNVRYSDAALDVDQLLFTDEGVGSKTVGYWQFETKPDVFADASGHGLNIEPVSATKHRHVNLEQAALIDFCHVLLNASEFLYVE